MLALFQRNSFVGRLGLLCLGLLCGVSVHAQQPDREWLTVAEASDFRATSRSDQVDDFLVKCDAAAEHVSLYKFGQTFGKRDMWSAVVAQPPWDIERPDSRPVALVIANIHSGECDGKEAVLMLLRELTQNPDHPWLQDLVLIFVPNYNADANDMMALDNRRGQVGPDEGMGLRENLQKLDLNRDFIKLESPEARSLISLIDKVNPELFIDCHTTNGSRHRYQLTYDIPHNPSAPESVREFMRQKMMPEITERLEPQGWYTFYYGNFNRDHTQWTTYGFEPRYSTEYVGLRGRLAVLSESYSYISYRDRIFATKAFVSECLNFLQRNSQTVQTLLTAAEEDWLAGTSPPQPKSTVALDAELKPFAEPFVVKGFAGEEPHDYTVQFLSHYVPAVERTVPFAYVFPPTVAIAEQKLQAHGIQVETLIDDWSGPVEIAQIQKVDRQRGTFQGHQMVRLKVQYQSLERSFPAGTRIVRSSQPLGRLACYLLEPETNDGLVTWNFLDSYLQDAEFPIVRINSAQPLKTEPLPRAQN